MSAAEWHACLAAPRIYLPPPRRRPPPALAAPAASGLPATPVAPLPAARLPTPRPPLPRRQLPPSLCPPPVTPHRHLRGAHPPRPRPGRPPACLPPPPRAAGPICPYFPRPVLLCPSDSSGGGPPVRCPDSAPVVWHACVTESFPEAPYLAIWDGCLGGLVNSVAGCGRLVC